MIPLTPSLTSLPLPLASAADTTPLNRLDLALAAFLQQAQPSEDPRHAWLAALVSHQYGRGHACLDLAALQREPGPTLGWEAQALQALPADLTDLTDVADGLAAADSLPWVQGPNSPLVREGQRLYLRRNWAAEQAIRQSIEARLALPPKAPAGLAQALAQLFPPDAAVPGPDWQKVACALAARQRLTLVTGGPGTGKTTTVVRLLAVLQALAIAGTEARPLRIRLAAPTGKAAARLNESIAGAVARLPLAGLADAEAVRAAIPVQVTTLHRLLGSRPDTRHFRHHAGNPLPVDVLVVDEASMVDLEMMAAVLAALPPGARLVLLGDKDQLASVEAGAVLGDLCRDAVAGRYDAATRAHLAASAGVQLPTEYADDAGPRLAQHTVMLRESRRFGGVIGQLAQAVNAGDRVAVQALLTPRAQAEDPAIRALQGGQPEALLPLACAGRDGAPGGYGAYVALLKDRPAPGEGEPAQRAHEDWVRQVLAAFDRFRLLCAVRDGAWGTEALNRAVPQALARLGLRPQGEWYVGRPVMVTRNDPALGVFNGDIGMVLPGARSEALRAWFLDGQTLRSVGVGRLAHVETAFAMTVHKSQGSEFWHTALVLPEQAGSLLSRELVYTGITRAREAFTLVTARAGALEEAVQQPTRRVSGLLRMLDPGAARPGDSLP